MSPPDDVHSLAGAYALNAVDDAERAAFDSHLAQCESCALEVAELAATAARLADPVATAPPAGLREAVLARVATTEQVRGAAAPRPAPPTRLPGGPSRGPTGPGFTRPGAAGRWRRWSAAAVAAGLLAAGAGAGAYLVQEQRLQERQDRLEAVTARTEAVAAVLSASDAQVRQEPAAGAGRVTVVGSRLRDQAVVVLSALPDPLPDQAYQLWLGTGGELVSAGVLDPGAGSATALVGGLGAADLVGVSLEPAGGSPTGQPTPDRIVATVPVA